METVDVSSENKVIRLHERRQARQMEEIWLGMENRAEQRTDDDEPAELLTLESAQVFNDDEAVEMEEWSRIIASSFLKYTGRGRRLFNKDSVGSFIQLHWLHRQLQDEAMEFLDEKFYQVRNLAMQKILVEFATFRVVNASRVYWEKVDRFNPKSRSAEHYAKALKACQQDLFNLLNNH